MHIRNVRLAALLTRGAGLRRRSRRTLRASERRDQWQKVEEIFAAMGVKPGQRWWRMSVPEAGTSRPRLSRAVGEEKAACMPLTWGLMSFGACATECPGEGSQEHRSAAGRGG